MLVKFNILAGIVATLLLALGETPMYALLGLYGVGGWVVVFLEENDNDKGRG